MKRGALYLVFLVLISNLVLAANPFVQDTTPPKGAEEAAENPPDILEFLCDGCFYNNKCLDVESQYAGDAGEIYCSIDKKVKLAKQDNEACNFNYECKSFYCDEICTRPVQRSNLFRNTVVILIAVFIFLIVFLAFRIKPKKRKRVKTATKATIRKIKPKNREDKLEKQIKSSMEELKRTFKK